MILSSTPLSRKNFRSSFIFVYPTQSFIVIIIVIAMSDNPFTRAARAGKRVDYYRLNDGSDDEVDIADQVEPLPKWLNIPSNSFEPSIEYVFYSI